MKIISVEFENLKRFQDGNFKVDFFATDKVFKAKCLYEISKSIYLQPLIGFIGLNATGKTTALRLLKIALNIVVYNTDLNSFDSTNNILKDGTVIRTTFFHNEKFYQLESVIGCKNENSFGKEQKFFYKEEILHSKSKSEVHSRKELTNFQGEKLLRSKLPQDVKNYLPDSQSFVNPIIKGNNCFVGDNLFFNYVNMMSAFGNTPTPVLELFDESIEQLAMATNLTSNSIEWNLKFKQDDMIYRADNPLSLNLLISTGTIRGQGLILRAVDALKSGGYLITDELELHLNKEIVKVILSLFKDPRTNPNGACLIFSTHYAEIFDFSILDRKDNIYITRKADGLLSVSKFSNEFKRNDFKKSEIFLSNALTGTAPKYDNIQRLRDFICKNL